MAIRNVKTALIQAVAFFSPLDMTKVIGILNVNSHLL
jgi:hypothetical protein